jgi:hypothetical protein
MTDRIRLAASAELTANLGLRARDGSIDPSRFVVEELPRRGALRLYDALLAVDHSDCMIVGADSAGTLYFLGGFSQPALGPVNALLGPVQADSTHRYDRAVELIELADPFGGDELYYPGRDQRKRPALNRFWQGQRPRDWPSDTVVTRADGSTLVRLTALSHRVRAFAPIWSPLAYAFVFDPEGHLVSWSRREADWLPSAFEPDSPDTKP